MPAPSSLRRALVTGGSGELGGAIAHALALGGYHVIVHANHSLHRAEAVVGEIVTGGGSAQATAFDVSDAEVSRAALDVLLGEGSIHAVINNAGIHDDAPMAGMSAEQWHRVIDVSLQANGSHTELVSVFDVKGEGQLKPIVNRLFEARATERSAQFAECLQKRFSQAGA